MRFGNVDDQERNFVAVCFIELVEGRNLPPEGRSSVASKYKHHRLSLSRQRGQPYLCALVQLRQGKIRRRIAHLQAAGTGAHPQGFKWKHKKCNRTGNSGHDSCKILRRLPHDRVQRPAGGDPQEREHGERRNQPPSYTQSNLRTPWLDRASRRSPCRCRMPWATWSRVRARASRWRSRPIRSAAL